MDRRSSGRRHHSIICLLSSDQLPLHDQVRGGLITYYRNSGFIVEHIPAARPLTYGAEPAMALLTVERGLGRILAAAANAPDESALATVLQDGAGARKRQYLEFHWIVAEIPR